MISFSKKQTHIRSFIKKKTPKIFSKILIQSTQRSARKNET
jgi:hypothetical protein